jgi:hypothetical protein
VDQRRYDQSTYGRTSNAWKTNLAIASICTRRAVDTYPRASARPIASTISNVDARHERTISATVALVTGSTVGSGGSVLFENKSQGSNLRESKHECFVAGQITHSAWSSVDSNASLDSLLSLDA